MAQERVTLGSSSVGGGSLRTGTPPPHLASSSEKGNCVPSPWPRAWLTEHPARTRVQVYTAVPGSLVKAMSFLGISQTSSEAPDPQPSVPKDKGHAREAPWPLQHEHPDASRIWEKGEFCRPQPEPKPASPVSARPKLGSNASSPDSAPPERGQWALWRRKGSLVNQESYWAGK